METVDAKYISVHKDYNHADVNAHQPRPHVCPAWLCPVVYYEYPYGIGDQTSKG